MRNGMVVYENSLITLAFAPETDTLLATWTNTELYSSFEVKQTLEKLTDVLITYNIKNLLIDARQGNVGMNDDDYRTIVIEFLNELGKTPLRKFARVITSDPLREEKIYTIRQKVVFPFEFEDFRTREEAYSWLASQ